MRTYSDEFKSAMIQRLIGPHAISAHALARETGVSQAALSKWLRSAKNAGSLPPKDSNMTLRPQDKTPEQKLQLVLQAASLSDEELGSFLRQEGLHTTHLQQWRGEMLSALHPQRQASSSSKELRALKKKNQQLQKELSRKDAALAETAALLVLQKKVQVLWGDEDANI